MKTRITIKKVGSTLLFLFLMMFSVASYSQACPGNNVTVTVTSIVNTPANNTVEFDVNIVNTGTTTIKLSSLSGALIHNVGFATAGTFTVVSQPSANDFPGFNNIASSAYTAASRQLRWTHNPVLEPASVILPLNTTKKFARFRFVRTGSDFPVNFAATLTFQEFVQSGYTAVNPNVYCNGNASSTPLANGSAGPPPVSNGYLVVGGPYNFIVNQNTVCFTSGTFTQTGACAGNNDGTATITMTPTPSSLLATYVLDGGASTPVTLTAGGTFTLTGLAAGAHTLAVTGDGTCNVPVSVPFTIDATATQTPTFNAIAPICSGATLSALPTTSTNGFTGTWAPALDNTTTTTYTFTPNVGQCATSTTLTITVKPLPTVNAVANQTLCNGATTTAVTFTGTPPTVPQVYTVSPFNNKIYTIPTSTYQATTEITATLAGFTVVGINSIAYDPSTLQYYVVARVGSAANQRRLGTLNPVSGVITDIASLGDKFSGLTFSPAGNLWGVTGNGATCSECLYTINKTTAATTFIRTLGVGADGENILFNPADGFLYHWSGNATVEFEKLDTTLYNGTPIGTYATGVGAGEIFGTSIDPLTGDFIINDINSRVERWTATGPVADIGVTKDIAGTDIDVRGFVNAPALPGAVYNWTNNTPSIGLAASGTGNIPAFTATNTSAVPVTATITVTPNSNGCNGTPAVFTITVNPTTTNGSVTTSICAGGSYTWPSPDGTGLTYTTAQTNLTNTVGCNTATLNLTITPLTTNGSVTTTACGSYTWALPFGTGLTYTTNQTNLTNTVGCNTATLNLTLTSIDYANLQFPDTSTICQGSTFTAYGQVYEAGITEAAGQGAGIDVEFGISPVGSNTNPSTWTNWTTATFNVQVGNNDEYQSIAGASLTAGTYYYTFRYKLSSCTTWQYGGYPNGFWNGTTQNSGVLTVNPATTNGSVTTSICAGGSYTWPLPNGTGLSYTTAQTNLTNTVGCNTATLNLTITPAVTPTFTQVAPVCAGATIAALPTTSNNGIAGTWAPAIDNTTTTTYTFTPTSAVCTTTATMTIVVNALPAATFGANPFPVCAGTSTTLTANVTNFTPTVNFVDGSSVSQNFNMNAAAFGTPVASPLSAMLVNSATDGCTAYAPGTFTGKIVLIQRGTCSFAIKAQNAQDAGAIGVLLYNNVAGALIPGGAAAGVTIPVYGITQANGLALISAMTGGQLPVTLSPSPTLSYLWSTGGTTNSINTGILNANTDFSVTITNTATGCSNLLTVTVPVTANTVPTFTQVAPICSGGTLAALPTTSDNGVAGSWAPALDNTTTTTYTFTPTPVAGQCLATATMTIVVNSAPTPTGSSTQSFSVVNPNDATIANIVVSPAGVIWYGSLANAQSGTNPLPTTTVLTNNATYYAVNVVGACSSTPFAVTVTVTLGNDEFNSLNFAFYPNPTSSVLNISYSRTISDIQVMNLLGQEVMKKKTNDTDVQIDLSPLADATYFIKVTSEGSSKIIKVIKKN